MPTAVKASFEWVSPTKLALAGHWTIDGVHVLQKAVAKKLNTAEQKITIDLSGIIRLDSCGSLMLLRFVKELHAQGASVEYVNITENMAATVQMVQDEVAKISDEHELEKITILNRLGEWAVEKGSVALDFLTFFGRVAVYLYMLCLGAFRLQWAMIGKVIENTGFRALPIVALLSFLIGVVITYQVSEQLATYGANVYIVNLTGVITLREFAPLVTAIILAGRTSTSFTAEIGSMLLNQEVDALSTLGVEPLERLVLPKLIGLLIVTPLLVVWADLFGLIGSMLMSEVTLSIKPLAFIHRFREVVDVSHVWVGLVKTPFFATTIVTVGCFQGFSVAGSSVSLGSRTTQSAVQSIFLVIVIDAAFSIVFSVLGV